jgi:hypothetical protein
VNQQEAPVRGLDRYPAMERARDAITASSGQDRGDELRRWAEALAYRSAMEHVAALRDIESSLAAAATKGWKVSDPVAASVLDTIRTFMGRGLMRAAADTGDRPDYWRPR